MLSPESKKLLTEMSTSQYGRAIREYIEEELAVLNDVEKCESWDDTLGRAHAGRILKRMLALIAPHSDKPKTPHQYT